MRSQECAGGRYVDSGKSLLVNDLESCNKSLAVAAQPWRSAGGLRIRCNVSKFCGRAGDFAVNL